MSFIQAMNASVLNDSTIKKGVNGAIVYTEEGVGDKRVALFTMLHRGLNKEYLQQSVRDMFHDAEYQLHLFKMAFQTRDIRGGKGEKQLFYDFIEVLYELDPHTTRNMMCHVPEYGCWRDMWELMRLVPGLSESILQIVKETFFKDRLHFTSGNMKKMSLLSKWLPREGSKTYKGFAMKLATALYPTLSSQAAQLVTYRKEVSAMNRALQTVEIAMCGGTWATIKPATVPGRCLKIHTKAFFNQSCSSKSDEHLRYPDSANRMACRSHFEEYNKGIQIGTKKVHGAHTVMPHELVMKGLSCNITNEEHIINQGQWVSIRSEMEKGGGLRKAVAMCDFSGSMDGLPKYISLALGILISEVTHPTFRDHILSFDATPKWHSFVGCTTLKEKLDTISSHLGQGLNTDFYKACLSILDRMVEHKVPVGEEPEDLIVLTDMGFDSAAQYHYSNNRKPFQIQGIRDLFRAAGEQLWGQGWKAPRIVIWNLRAAFNDFHAKADQEGVVQLSGWSPNILKAIQKSGVQVLTPFEGMMTILADERYTPILQTWDHVKQQNRT